MTDPTQCTYLPWIEANPPLATKQCVHWDGRLEKCELDLPAGCKCERPWIDK